MIIGSRKVYYEKLSSTNTMAATLIRKGNMPEGTIIHAGYQFSGKGQMGNRWDSEEGKNLLISIILYPSVVKADMQFIISKVISLGIVDFLRQVTGRIFIKWPNDIYIESDKIAGILIENTVIRNDIEHTIAGIGININQTRFSEDIPNPTSLKIITGEEHDLENCLASLSKAIDIRYKQLLYERNNQIDKDYISSLYRFNVWSEFNDNKGIFEGKIVSVTDSGRLHIEDRRGRIYEFGFREVDFL
jgi:BirA family transcriptional regulator, biotin operon repressor / biotin---[acetyl-CoA-carboxylase] ligase